MNETEKNKTEKNKTDRCTTEERRLQEGGQEEGRPDRCTTEERRLQEGEIGKYNKIIFIRGAVETLEYFSYQMADCYRKMCLDVCFWDMHRPLESRNMLKKYLGDITAGNSLLITFNFIGLSGEGQFESDNKMSIWEEYGIDVLCIMVDHPIYYAKQLKQLKNKAKYLCVDNSHVAFIKRFYWDIQCVGYMPLAGNLLPQKPSCCRYDGENCSVEIPSGFVCEETISEFSSRGIDILFAGNYVELEKLLAHTTGMGDEYKKYINGIIDEIINNPEQKIDDALINHFAVDFPDASDSEIVDAMSCMIFMDLYIRSYFRRKIICDLAENGLKVTLIGKDWDKSGCKRMDNLVTLGSMDSLSCLKYMKMAKISLNIMPWFKEGAHDRVFSAMNMGALCVTDSSKYLDGELLFGINAVKYSLSEIDSLSQMIGSLLNDESKISLIAAEGFAYSNNRHTWRDRAQMILGYSW